MQADRQDRVPSTGAVAAEQFRMLLLLQRRDFLIAFGIGAVLAALSVWGITTMPTEGRSPQTIQAFLPLVIPLMLLGALWPLGVWRHAKPSERGYLRSLPVPPGPLTLMRTGFGWVFLIGLCVLAMVATVALARFYLATAGDAVIHFDEWLRPLASATLAYLLVSALAVHVEGPARLAIWTLVAFAATRGAAQMTGIEWLAEALDRTSSSFLLAVTGFASPRALAAGWSWGVHYGLWFALGATALVLGAWRYREPV